MSEKLIGQQRAIADLLATADREHAHDLLQILLDVEDPDDLQYAIQVAMENGDGVFVWGPYVILSLAWSSTKRSYFSHSMT